MRQLTNVGKNLVNGMLRRRNTGNMMKVWSTTNYFFCAMAFETLCRKSEGAEVRRILFRFAAKRLGRNFTSYCGTSLLDYLVIFNALSHKQCLLVSMVKTVEASDVFCAIDIFLNKSAKCGQAQLNLWRRFVSSLCF